MYYHVLSTTDHCWVISFPPKWIIHQIVLHPKPNTQRLVYSLFRWCNHSVSPSAIHPSSTVKVDARHGQKSSCQSDAIGAGLQEETLDSCWLWSGPLTTWVISHLIPNVVPHNLSHITPQANGCTREFDSQFSEVDSKNYLGSQPWPANTSNRKSPWKSTFNPMAIRVCPACFARKVEGLELDIAVCIARLGRNTRTGERFESWKLFFLEIVNVQGRKMFFFGRKSGWTFFAYITVYIYIYV